MQMGYPATLFSDGAPEDDARVDDDSDDALSDVDDGYDDDVAADDAEATLSGDGHR